MYFIRGPGSCVFRSLGSVRSRFFLFRKKKFKISRPLTPKKPYGAGKNTEPDAFLPTFGYTDNSFVANQCCVGRISFWVSSFGLWKCCRERSEQATPRVQSPEEAEGRSRARLCSFPRDNATKTSNKSLLPINQRVLLYYTSIRWYSALVYWKCSLLHCATITPRVRWPQTVATETRVRQIALLSVPAKAPRCAPYRV